MSSKNLLLLIKNLRSKKDDANKLYFLSQTFEGERTTANKGREKCTKHEKPTKADSRSTEVRDPCINKTERFSKKITRGSLRRL